MDRFSIQDARELYGIDAWGAHYFDINDKGQLIALPSKQKNISISFSDIIKEAKKDAVSTPLLLRFPQILSSQVKLIVSSFEQAIAEYNYKENYLLAYPIKVNQKRSVVETIMQAGFDKKINIEVGSKAEAVASFNLKLHPEALTICNGYKDKEYYSVMATGQSLGRNMMAVIEKPFELEGLFELKKNKKNIPDIGFRIKLEAKGSGLWHKSGGSASKFGLSMNQLLRSLELLKEQGLLNKLKMFHFHIGSQITDVRKIKMAIREAARVYAKCKKMGLNIEYLNVGGGLGIDYDGSKTSSDASVNYTVQEYANDVVYSVLEVCEQESVEHPKLISESGRFLVAYHSVLLVDVRDQYHERYSDKPQFKKKETSIIEDILYIEQEMTAKNYREFYHDSLQKKDELQSLFHLGMLSLEDRAKGEWLFWSIVEQTLKFSKNSKYMADEFVALEEKLHEKLVCNFSLFQSLPDHWALDQLFPIIPVSQLHKRPSRKAKLVDITCDSDGEIESFVNLKNNKNYLDVHKIDNYKDYHLAFLLIGAYQDTMGDMHNLFGAVNEFLITVGKNNNFKIEKYIPGEKVNDTVSMFAYNKKELLNNAIHNNHIKLSNIEKEKLEKELSSYLNMYTYLTE